MAREVVQSSRIFIDLPASIALNASVTPLSGTTSVISVSLGIAPVASRRAASSKSSRSAPCPISVSSRQNTRNRSTGGGDAWMPTTTARPCAPRQPIAVPIPAAVAETSKATSAPAAAVQSPPTPPCPLLGSSAGRPTEAATPAPALVRLEHRHLGPAERATAAISRPIGPPPTTTTCSPGGARRGVRRAPRRRSARPAPRPGSRCPQAGGRARRPARSRRTASTRARRSPGRPAGDRVRRATSASRAHAARDERHHRRRIADRPALDTVAGRRNAPRHLVAEHRRHRDSRVHRAVEDVEVGAADPRVGDLELHLSRRRSSDVGLDELESAVADVAGHIHMMSIYPAPT